MKLSELRFQYVIVSSTLLGVEDMLTGEIKLAAEYSLPSDILHMTPIGEYINIKELPPISAEKMARLFKTNICAIYLELH